jgi:hypothetical protein
MNKGLCGRRHTRVKFIYPVEFSILTQGIEGRSYMGMFSVISMNGALFEFVDKCGLVDIAKIIEAPLKMKIEVSRSEYFFAFAKTIWAKRVDSGPEPSIMLATEFEYMSQLQMDTLERVISRGNRAREVMLSLRDSISAGY